jgi:LysM repeat protein
MNLYGDKYNTTVDAILEINSSLKLPMRVGAILVIPVGISDVSSLPAFEAYEVTEPSISIEEVASELNASVDEIKYYNALNNGETLVAGDWLLIPHPRTAP